MKLITSVEEFKYLGDAVVTSGAFDGMHFGHKKVLAEVVNIAKSKKLKSVVITFWPHPRLVIHPEQTDLKLLSTLDEKIELIENEFIDYLLVIPFSREFSQMSSRSFIEDVLVKAIGTRYLVIGHDHRFGRDREGGYEWLAENSAEFGFEVAEIKPQLLEEVSVSSTHIRKALEVGDVSFANSMLGRRYCINGFVVKGKQNGVKIGFPTANVLVPEKYKLIPADGVYAIRALFKSQTYVGMMNIGMRPTFKGTEKSLEAHIFDFSGNLYGEEIQIQFEAFIRHEVKFPSVDELVKQLRNDEKTCRNLFEKK